MGDNERNKALEDIRAGMSAADAARKYGKKPATVRQWVKRYLNGDIVTRDKRDSVTKVPKTAAEVDRIIADAVEDNNELTQKQKDFCRYFIRNRNATQAYLKAYDCSYSVANTEGPKLLVNPRVKEELRRLRAIKNEALGDFGADDIVELHMRIAFADSSDFFEFENRNIPVLDKNGSPKYTLNPETGKAEELYRNINEVRLKSSDMVDGQLINGISEGREGLKLNWRTSSALWLFWSGGLK